MKKILLSILVATITILTAGCGDTTSGLTSSNDTALSEANTISNYDKATPIVLSNDKTETITTAGSYTISGTASNAKIVVDSIGIVKLELAGIDVDNSNGAVIEVTNAKDVTLTLKAGTSNKIADGGATEVNAAIFSNDKIFIEGDGELIVTGNQEHGVESDDAITINGGTITITAVNDAIHSNEAITINGGVINVLDATEGIESKDSIVVNGGIVKVVSSDDGLNATNDITVNGGELYIRATKGDAIDSNGTININDGIVLATGGIQPEGGIDCDGNTFVINGGTLVATGGSNSAPNESSSTQRSVALAGVAANTILHIEGDNGGILSFVSDHQYSSMLFSSPLLEKDKTYTIYTGGTASGDDTNGLYIDAEYQDGTKGDEFTVSAMHTKVGGNAGMGGGMRPDGGKGERPNFDGTTPLDREGLTPPDMQNPTSSNNGEIA